MSHTPGPWKTVIANYTKDNLSRLVCADVVTPRGTTLVRFEGMQDYKKNDEHEANARLIAAAPDMLEILIELQARGLRDVDAATRARVQMAIDKARGES